MGEMVTQSAIGETVDQEITIQQEAILFAMRFGLIWLTPFTPFNLIFYVNCVTHITIETGQFIRFFKIIDLDKGIIDHLIAYSGLLQFSCLDMMAIAIEF